LTLPDCHTTLSCTTGSVPTSSIPALIPKPVTSDLGQSHLLPPFLHFGSKITYEHNGQYHEGFLSQSKEGVYRFSYKSHINNKSKDWGVDILDLPMTWQDLCTDGILLPGHQSSSFLCPPSSSANFVSTCNLKMDCPHSLLVMLEPSHPDCSIWLDSF
jgi:hypothetical protein